MKTTHVYFSPNSETERIARHFADALGGKVYDITGFVQRKRFRAFDCECLVLSFPVYSADIPEPLKPLLGRFQAKNVVLNVTFGGMTHGDILHKVERCMNNLSAFSLTPVKHAYLPDGPDIDFSHYEGLIERVRTGKLSPTSMPRFKEPFFYALFRRTRSRFNYRLTLDRDLCTECRLCILECPVGAISETFDISKACLRCSRCVKWCPEAAIRAKTSFLLRRYLRKEPITEVRTG